MNTIIEFISQPEVCLSFFVGFLVSFIIGLAINR